MSKAGRRNSANKRIVMSGEFKALTLHPTSIRFKHSNAHKRTTDCIATIAREQLLCLILSIGSICSYFMVDAQYSTTARDKANVSKLALHASLQLVPFHEESMKNPRKVFHEDDDLFVCSVYTHTP